VLQYVEGGVAGADVGRGTPVVAFVVGAGNLMGAADDIGQYIRVSFRWE
jgi:hypothetical protein